MKAISLTLSIYLGLAINPGVIAQSPTHDCDDLVINSITYIEEEDELELGFETEDYLPLDFDPYKPYVNLKTIQFIEENETVVDLADQLPADFNAHAFPKYFRYIDYIDTSDEIIIDFETEDYLPEDFDPYFRTTEVNNISL